MIVAGSFSVVLKLLRWFVATSVLVKCGLCQYGRFIVILLFVPNWTSVVVNRLAYSSLPYLHLIVFLKFY